jgi:hypothetical protein
MPRPDFLPRRDAEFNSWVACFVNRVSADPQRYSISPDESALLVDRAAEFDAALALAVAPSTRTRPAVARKNACRRSLAACVRPLARRIQGLRSTDDAVRAALGLSVTGALRAPALGRAGPRTRPALSAKSLEGRRVPVRLWDEGAAGRRGKPRGIVGAVLFARVTFSDGGADGDRHAAGDGAYAGIATRAVHTVVLPASAVRAGGKLADVWLTARWFDLRGREGPAATPVRALAIP